MNCPGDFNQNVTGIGNPGAANLKQVTPRSETSSSVSDLSGITAYNRRLRRSTNIDHALFLGKCTVVFLFIAFGELFILLSDAAIPASIPLKRGEDSGPRVPDNPSDIKGTLLAICGFILFLIFDKVISTRTFGYFAKKLRNWLEGQSEDTKLYQAFAHAKASLSDMKSEAQPDPEPPDRIPRPGPLRQEFDKVFQIDIPDGFGIGDIGSAVSTDHFVNSDWKLVCATFFEYCLYDFRARFSSLKKLIFFYCITHGFVVGSDYLITRTLHVSLDITLASILAFCHILRAGWSKTKTALKDDDTASTMTGSAFSESVWTRARRIREYNPLEDAARKGADYGSCAPADLSICSSADSTIDSAPVGEFGELLMSDPVMIALFKHFEMSTQKAIFHFMLTAFSTVSWEANRALCVAGHLRNFHYLTGALVNLHGSKIRYLWAKLREEIHAMGGNFSLETEDEEEKDTWIMSISQCLHGLEKFENSPVGVTASGFLGILCTLPILIQDFWDADTYMKSWKVIVKSFKTSGASMSKILSSFVSVYRGCLCALTTRSPTLALKALFVPDELNSEFLNCWEILSAFREGRDKLHPKNFENLRVRFHRLMVRSKARVGAGAKPADIARAKDCYNMFNELCFLAKIAGPRMVPYVLSLDGLPGTAKTSFLQAIIPIMHDWIDKKELMHTSFLDLTASFDETTFNYTTCCVADDQGNIKVEFRAAPLSGMMLKNVQSIPGVVNKSAVEDKGRHLYLNDFLLIPDNERERGLSAELLAPQAAYRRLGLCVEVEVLPEFQNASGGLDTLRAETENPFGGCQRFRPYRFVKRGNQKSEPQYVKTEDDGWMDNFEFLTYLKADILEHRRREQAKLDKIGVAHDQSLCQKCKLLPPSYCPCGQDFMDSREDETVVFEKPITLDNVGNEMAQVFGPAIERTKVQVNSYLMAILSTAVTTARMKAGDSYRWYWWLERAFLSGFTNAIFGFFFFTSLITLAALPRPHALVSLLTSMICYALSLIVTKHWKRLASLSAHQLVMHSVSLSAWFKPGVVALISAITIAVSTPRIWTSLVDFAHPAKITNESLEEPVAQVVEDSKRDLPLPLPPPDPAPPQLSELSAAPPMESESMGCLRPQDELLHKEESDKRPSWKHAVRCILRAEESALTTIPEVLKEKVMKNTFRVKIQPQGATVSRTQHLIMLNERIGVTTAHAFVADVNGEKQIQHATLSVVDEIHNNPGVIKVNKNQMCVPKGTDMVFIYFGAVFGHLPHLQHYLSLETPSNENTDQDHAVCLQRVWRENSDVYSQNLMAIHIKSRYQLNYSEKDLKDVLYNEVYAYNDTFKPSAEGQCGLPYLHVKPACLAGIHVAGNKLNAGLVQPITMAYYMSAYKFFVDEQGFHPPLERRRFVPLAGKLANECLEDPTHPVFFQTEGEGERKQLEVVSWVETNRTPRSKLKYNPYLQQAKDHLGLRILKLKPKYKWRKAAHKALEHGCKVLPQGDLQLLKESLEIFRNEMLIPGVEAFKERYGMPEWATRPLTPKEVAGGIDGTPIKGIDPTKSSGISGVKGDYLVTTEVETETGTKIERDFVPEIYADLERMLEMLDKDDLPVLPPTAFLKDELLKVGKEPRSIYNSALQVYVLSAQYLKLSLEIINNQPLLFGSALGLDPVGEQWFAFCRPFSEPRFLGNAFDIDQAHFDLSQADFVRIMSSLPLSDVGEMFEWSEEDVRRTRKVTSMLDGLPVNLYGCVIYLLNILPSGYLYTAHRNGIIGILILMYDMVRFCKKHNIKPNFRSYFVARTLGDDLVAAVSVYLRSLGWDLNHYWESASHWGLKITTANKDTNFQFKNFEDTEFLKRYYSYHSDLKMNVFISTPVSFLNPFVGNIRDKEWEPNFYYAEQTRSALLECFFGGRESYEFMKAKFRRFYDNVDLARPLILQQTYEDLLEEYRPSEPQPQLFPVVDRGMRILREYFEQPVTPAEMTLLSAESEPTEKVVLQELEGLVEDSPVETHETSMDRLPMASDTSPDLVLSRKAVIAQIDGWPTDATPLLPFQLMFQQPMFRDRLKNIAFSSVTVEVTFEVIVPSTAAGVLLVSIFHYPDLYSNTGVLDRAGLMNTAQREHIQIRVGEKTTIHKIDVPFLWRETAVSPFDESIIAYLPQLRIAPVTKLISSVDSAPGLQIRVYGRFKDMKGFGATGIRNPAGFFAEAQTNEVPQVFKDKEVPFKHSKNVLYQALCCRVKLAINKKAYETQRHGPGHAALFTSSFRDPVTGKCFHSLTSPESQVLRPMPSELSDRHWYTTKRKAENAAAAAFLKWVDWGEYIKLARKRDLENPEMDDHKRVKLDATLELPTPPVSSIPPAVKETIVPEVKMPPNLMTQADIEEEKRILEDVEGLYSDVFPKTQCQVLPSLKADGMCYLEGVPHHMRADYHKKYGLWPHLSVFGSAAFRDLSRVDALPRVIITGKGRMRHVVANQKGMDLYQWSRLDLNILLGGPGDISESKEKISNTLKAAGNLAKEASKIPGLGGLATPADIVSGAGHIAAHFGFSKPQSRHSVGLPANYIPNGMGELNADTLTVNPYNEISGGIPGWDKDELQFSEFTSKWNLIAVSEFGAGVDYGAVIYELNVTPTIVIDGIPATCAAPALFMEFWRGSMEYELELVCPSLVSTKLAVYYEPLGYNHDDLLGEQPEYIEDHMEHVILDSSNLQKATITVGYSMPLPGLFTMPKGIYKINGEPPLGIKDLNTAWEDKTLYRHGSHNGRLIIKLHDKVRGGASSPPNVELIIKARAGPDIQFGGYRGALPPGFKLASPTKHWGLRPNPNLIDCGFSPPGANLSCEPPPIGSTAMPTAESSTAPTTQNPTTGAPAPTQAPSSATPTASAPTVAPCTFTNVVSAHRNFHSDYGPRLYWDELTATQPQLRFEPDSGQSADIFVPTWCGGVTLDIEVFDGIFAAYSASHALEILSLAPGRFEYYFQWDHTYAAQANGTHLAQILLECSGAGSLKVHKAIATYPDGYDSKLRTIAKNGGTEAEHVDATTFGDLQVSNPTSWVGSANTAAGTPLSGYTIPAGRAIKMPIPENTNLTQSAYEYVYINFTFYGSLTVRDSDGSPRVNSSKNVWRIEGARFPAVGGYITIETPVGTSYPVALIRQVCFYGQGPIISGRNDTTTSDPNLIGRRRGLMGTLSNITGFVAEAEIEEKAEVDGSNHHLGAPLDYTEYFSRSVTGETVVSFRPLLKIPHHVRTYTTPSGVSDSLAVGYIYTDGETSLMRTPYWFLHSCFCAVRGSVVYHYNIIGNGSIEVSRRWFPDYDGMTSTEGGFVTTDSRVNPFLSVRLQSQRPYVYTIAAGLIDNPEDAKFVRIYGWNEPVRVREFRSTGEDFNLTQFRGMPRLYSA